MNKKVLTLCAGLLMAGGVLSTVNALNLEQAVELNKNSGDLGAKYYCMHLNASFNGSFSLRTDYYYATEDNGFKLEQRSTSNLSVVSGDLSSYWKVEVDRVDAQGTWYKLTNADGKRLTVDYGGVELNSFLTVYDAATESSFLYCLDGATPVRVCWDGSNNLVASTTATNVACFNLVDIKEEVIDSDDMNKMLKGGFNLAIGHIEDAKYKDYADLQGNVFTGAIEAIPVSTTNNSLYYFYRKADKKYIVLTKEVWSENTANLDGKQRSAYAGYKFDVISEHAFSQLTSSEKQTTAQFQVLKSYDFNNPDSLIVTMPDAMVGEMPSTWQGDLNSTNTLQDKGVRLFVSTVDSKNYLTVIEFAKANDRLAIQQDDAYNGKDVNADGVPEPYQVGATAPYIKFGSTNILNIPEAFAGKIWNITRGTGENKQSLSPVVSADIDSYDQLFAPIAQVDLANPEGQWLLYKENGPYGEQYYFVNRESGAHFNVAAEVLNGSWVIRSTETSGVYEICENPYTTDVWQTVFITEAKDAELGLTENGYVKFDMDKELVNGKYFSFETGLGVTAYVGKDADDNVVLTTNKDEAIEFRVKQLSHDFRDHDGELAPDTLVHYTSYLKYNEKKELVTDVDTLRFFQYALYENFSEKYLKYDDENKKFVLSDEAFSPQNAHEKFADEYADYAFVVKEKEDGSYILVREYNIDYDYCLNDATHNHLVGKNWDGDDYAFGNCFETNLYLNAYDVDDKYENGVDSRVNLKEKASHKAYAATQPGTLTDVEGIYNYNDNDRIVMEDTDKAEYMTVTGTQDTVKISLEAKPNFYLYEQGRFLGMEHVADADMKAAILADTAYVRNNTYRPQYLLAVGTNIVKEVYDNAGHLLEPDTVYGRFLVNMVDSAYNYGISKKSNPYVWEELNGNPYFKLSFIDGYHTADTLYLNTPNTVTGLTKIALDNNKDKVCTFAFRYTDESREGVKIETAYGRADNQGNRVRGWLKYQNNVPVVTNDYEDAHVFLVNTEVEEAPTANEEIAAGNVVVAGVNGAVVVKGAEGKNVIVSTILGKVVANEVVSSDNATIAAPAGVVVVSVDGESFKVVVK